MPLVRKTNPERIKELASHPRKPRFLLGALVREPHGSVGAVTDIYADLEAAQDAGMIDDEWYGAQSIKPRTPKSGIWYGVIIPDGAVLAGEEDLVEVKS